MNALTVDPTRANLLIMTIQHGGARAGAGRKSIFKAKALAKAYGMDLTRDGRRELIAIAKRTRLSRNSVIAILALEYADRLTFDQPGVAFPEKAQAVLSIRVPARAGAKLRAAHVRTGKSYSDIGEALVRWFGLTAAFPAPIPKVRRSMKRAATRKGSKAGAQ